MERTRTRTPARSGCRDPGQPIPPVRQRPHPQHRQPPVAGCRWSDGPTATWTARSAAWSQRHLEQRHRTGDRLGVPREPPEQTYRGPAGRAPAAPAGASSHSPARERRSSGSGWLRRAVHSGDRPSSAGVVVVTGGLLQTESLQQADLLRSGTRWGAALVGVGTGPGEGEGTGEAEGAEPGAELDDEADPRGAEGPEAAGGGVADEADRAEYAELADSRNPPVRRWRRAARVRRPRGLGRGCGVRRRHRRAQLAAGRPHQERHRSPTGTPKRPIGPSTPSWPNP